MKTVFIVLCIAIVVTALQAGSCLDAEEYGRALTLGLLCFGNIGCVIALAIVENK